MAGKGGGAWKVAYADFVTAMMAFFMVMWITAQNEDVKEAIAQHFQDPFADLRGEEGEGHAPRQGSENTHHSGPKEDQPKSRGKPRPVRVELGKGNETTTGTTIYFSPESAELDEAAKERLAKLLPVLVGKPQKIEIRGHSSRRPLPAPSPYHNFWELSYARCLATMRHLQEEGIAPERMRMSQAGVYEPGTSLPGHDPAHQDRVEVHLLDEVAQHFTGRKPQPAETKQDSAPHVAADDFGGHSKAPAAAAHHASGSAGQ